ncbi:MAG: hypothetical protein WC815_19540 [Vicinamibacterales bacterium]|jgi:hypothetical protein
MPLLERIGVACPVPGERAAFQEWLHSAGYEPVPMLDLDSLARELSTRPIEALIADVSLIPAADLPRVIRILGANRPLIVVGEPARALEQVPRDVTWVDRPVTRDIFQLSIALALAEGRPARRSPRKPVPRLLAQVDGVSAKVMDVSTEGVRLEVTGATPSALPPYFTLRVPAFGIATKVKRVWVAAPGQSALWCGGIIERGQATRIEAAWGRFIETAPTTGEIAIRPS